MTTSRDAVLLPCPFCGQKSTTLLFLDGHEVHGCQQCDVWRPSFAQWNRRAHPEPCDRNAVIEECAIRGRIAQLENKVVDTEIRALKTQPTERAT